MDNQTLFKQDRNIPIDARGNIPRTNQLYTNEGHKLSSKEDRFISKYVETGNAAESARYAGYKGKDMSQKGKSKIAGIIEEAIHNTYKEIYLCMK